MHKLDIVAEFLDLGCIDALDLLFLGTFLHIGETITR